MPPFLNITFKIGIKKITLDQLQSKLKTMLNPAWLSTRINESIKIIEKKIESLSLNKAGNETQPTYQLQLKIKGLIDTAAQNGTVSKGNVTGGSPMTFVESRPLVGETDSRSEKSLTSWVNSTRTSIELHDLTKARKNRLIPDPKHPGWFKLQPIQVHGPPISYTNMRLGGFDYYINWKKDIWFLNMHVEGHDLILAAVYLSTVEIIQNLRSHFNDF